MATQFSVIEEPSFARGIDARSAENQIRDGFVRDLVNADIIEGRVKKRRGSAAYAGNIPVRVNKIRQTPGGSKQLCLSLDSSIDLSVVGSCPLIVYGKSSDIGTTVANITSGSITFTAVGDVLAGASFVYIPASTVTNIPAGYYYIRNRSYSSPNTTFKLSLTADGAFLVAANIGTVSVGNGPFTTVGDSLKYYTAWTSNLRKVFTANTTGSIQALASEHAIPSTNMYVGISETTAEESVDGLTRNGSSLLKAVSVAVSNYTITAEYTNNTNSSQNVFMYYLDRQAVIGEVYISEFSVAALDTDENYSVLGSGHGLNNNNILYQLYKKNSPFTAWEQVRPNSFTLNPGNGDVSLNLNGDNIAGDYKLILSAVPVSQTSTSPNITGIANPYIFYTAYQLDEDTGLLHEIIPDRAEYDASEGSWSLTYEHGTSPIPGTVQVIYEHGTIRANEFCVDDASVLTAETDDTPQLSVYGFDHTTIYGEDKKVNRRGWVNHIDSYRSPTTTHMVAGLGGNLFSALSVADTYIPSLMAAAMPTYFPRLNGKVATETKIGPAFCDTGSSPERTRGWVKFDTGGTNWGIVRSVVYNGTNTVYTIDAPGLVVNSTPIDTNDYLTIKNMSSSRHSGTFKIVSTPTYNTTTSKITITVDNPNIKNTDYNDPNTYGLAGVFTDRVTLAANTPFIVGDQILSSAWGDDIQLVVTGVASPASAVVYMGQVYDALTLGANLALTGRRTSATIPLRDINLNATTTNLVVGDTLSYTGFSRPLQIVAVNTTGDSTKVPPIPVNSITVDESFTWEDNISLPEAFSVARRWIPAEVPVADAADVLVKPTTIQHLSANPYDNQNFLRSAMVQNNMYLTNGSDEVYKYDGRNFYRAGIIPWQPGLFLSVENLASGGIPLLPYTTTSTIALPLLVEGGKLVLSAAEASKYAEGDNVVLTSSTGVEFKSTISTVTERTTGGTWLIGFSDPLTVTTVSKIVGTYNARYYFRLNIRDINQVVTASAVTGAEDFVVQVTPETDSPKVVNLRLVGMPPWDQYDYRNKNIELEIYRTFWTRGSIGETPVFYKIATKGLSFIGNDAYIDIIDTYSNSTLGGAPLDFVVGTLSPNTTPAAWDEPPRARYTTTAGNRLVLGNLTDWPTLAVQFNSASNPAAASFVGQKFTFKKDYSVVGSDSITYELRETVDAEETWPCDCGTNTQFKFVTASANPLAATGDWVYLYHKNVVSGYSQPIAFINNSLEFILTSASTLPQIDDLVYFDGATYAPTHSSGTPLDLTRGYFVVAVDSAVTTTVKSTVSASSTLPLNSAVGFPTSGTHFITVNGSVYSYNGTSIGGGTTSLTNVTPPISANSNDVVLLSPGVSISTSRRGIPLAFDNITATTVGTGTATTTVNVNSTTGFPSAGRFTINAGSTVYTYTGKTLTSLTGISPAIASYSAGQTVSFFTSFGSVNWDGSDLRYAGWWQVSSYEEIATTTAAYTVNNTINITGEDAVRLPTSGTVTVAGTDYAYTNKTGPVSGTYTLTGVTPSIIYSAGTPVTLKGVYRYVVSVAPDGLSTIPTQFPDRALFATASGDVPVLVDLDGNMGMFNGNGPIPSLNITRRLGMAINATMRTISDPWLVARSESDTGGQLIVKQPKAESTIPGLLAFQPTANTGYETYVNGSLVGVQSTVVNAAAVTKYPSRIAVSYDNYPEIFDNLWTIDPDKSDSIVDINSSDGQEITGIIPFFGESAFGAALQSGVLVVFKQNSIYLVDLGAKAAGQNAVQRLETQGLGCTAPYSIAPTKDGIAFANDSGIYVLRRNQRIEYLGRFMERNWQEKVDRSFLDIVQGHHYGVGRQYKLSVPMVEDSTSSYAENSQVYVYNHTGEADGETGGWARYTNHPATGWANLFKDAFYANVNGSVLRLRNLGEQTDYRDGPSAVESILETRATSFGNTGLRKIVSNCIIHYRSAENSAGTKVYFSPDLFEEYDESTNFKVKTNPVGDGLSTAQAQAVVSVMHSLVRRRCIYMSVKIINNTKDENVEVAGMSFVVGGLSSSGIKQAAETE